MGCAQSKQDIIEEVPYEPFKLDNLDLKHLSKLTQEEKTYLYCYLVEPCKKRRSKKLFDFFYFFHQHGQQL